MFKFQTPDLINWHLRLAITFDRSYEEQRINWTEEIIKSVRVILCCSLLPIQTPFLLVSMFCSLTKKRPSYLVMVPWEFLHAFWLLWSKKITPQPPRRFFWTAELEGTFRSLVRVVEVFFLKPEGGGQLLWEAQHEITHQNSLSQSAGHSNGQP